MHKNEQTKEDNSNSENRNEPFACEFDVKSMYGHRFNSFNCFFFHIQKVTLKAEAYYL